ncbi:MAG: peptidoglycan-binding domain-containing protein [Elainellaceae cyanobacterium]
MEVLGYLHGAIAYGSPEAQTMSQTSSYAKSQDLPLISWGVSWRRVSSISLLSLVCALSLCFSPTQSANATLLRHADRSPAVTQLQQGLTTAGYYHGPITGYYGDLTMAAVRRFQEAQGIIVDGLAGPQTLSALQRVAPGYIFSNQSAASPPSHDSSNPAPIVGTGSLSVGSTGPAVTQLQVQLTQAGYYAGSITDYYGPRTQDAVLRFQQANGLPQTGIADAQTLSVLASVAPNTTANTTGGADRRPFDISSSQSSRFQPNGISPGSQNSGVASFNTGVGTFAGQTSPGTLLYRGDRGPAVRQLQESLGQIGVYRGPVTGYYGSLTENAVYRFQQLNKVEPTGVAGPVTQQLIQENMQPI